MFRVLYKSELIPTDELGLRCEESLLQAAAVVQEMCLNTQVSLLLLQTHK